MGRALARLKTDLNGRLVWTLLNKQDFNKSGTKEENLEGVIDELIINTPDAEIVVIFYEYENDTKVIVNTVKSINGFNLFKKYKPTGTKNFTKFVVNNKDLLEVEKIILAKTKDFFNQQG